MEISVWTDLVPAVTVLGGSGAILQRLLVGPYLAARRREREALGRRMEEIARETAETRKEMHMMYQAFLEWRGKPA